MLYERRAIDFCTSFGLNKRILPSSPAEDSRPVGELGGAALFLSHSCRQLLDAKGIHPHMASQKSQIFVTRLNRQFFVNSFNIQGHAKDVSKRVSIHAKSALSSLKKLWYVNGIPNQVLKTGANRSLIK